MEQPLLKTIYQWFSYASTFTGVIGFCFTIAVMFQVRGIKKSFRSRVRLPELVKGIEKNGSGLNICLQEWPDLKNRAGSHVKGAAMLVKQASSFMNRNDKSNIKNIQEKLDKAAKTWSDDRYDNKEIVWDIYTDIQSLIGYLNQCILDLKWD